MPVPGHGTRSAFRDNPALLPGALVAGKAMVLRTAHGRGKGLIVVRKLASDRRVSGVLRTPWISDRDAARSRSSREYTGLLLESSNAQACLTYPRCPERLV